MSDQDRANSGARSAVDLLTALFEGDDKRAVQVVNSCDAGLTILSLGNAWLNLAEYAELNAWQMIESMRDHLPIDSP